MARTRGPCRPAAAAAILVTAALLAGCAGDEGTPAASTTWPNTVTEEYLPGLAADVHMPEPGPDGPVPIVLLIPGGGWQTADRTGLSPLAAALADAGMLAVNATYSAGMDGAVFPEPVQDVVCAARFAVARAESEGLTPGPLVVLGHSAGGHLAALAAIADDDPVGDCRYPEVRVDGLVGLAGIYDTASFAYPLTDFFGASRSEAPAAWASGDPIARVADGRAPTGLRVLLRHGDDDLDVPRAQSEAFAAALEAEGIPVQLEVVAGAGHSDIYSAAVSAELVIAWISEQWPATAPDGP